MLEKFEKACAILKELPADVCAVFMLIIGFVLSLCGHKDEAQLIIGGALGIFKGQK